MSKDNKNDKILNTIFTLLLFGSLLLFAGVPAIKLADNLSQATSGNFK